MFLRAVFLLGVALMASVSFGAGGEIVFIGGRYDRPDLPKLKPFFDRYFAASGERGAKRLRVVNGLDNLTSGDLASARTVIVFRGGNYELSDHDRAARDALVEYVRQGGGVVILNAFEQMFAYTEFGWELMKAFGGRFLYEGVITPKARCAQIGEWEPDNWAVTTQVDPLFAEGVTNVLYRTLFRQNWEHGAVPFLPTDDWKVALATEDDVRSVPFKKMGVDFLDRRLRPQGFDRRVPIVGYREFGKGRVVWFGISSLFERNVPADDAGGTETANRILEKGTSETGPVQTGLFLRNLLTWVGANASDLSQNGAAGVRALPTAAEMDKALGTDWRLFKGVVGPRTTLSSGKSTPEEYIAKAKSLGHDFIVFLEDFSSLSSENYEKLRTICRAATDRTFTAFPGYAFERDNGNRQFAFSPEPLYPGKKWLTPDGRKFISVWRDSPEHDLIPGSDANFSGCVDKGFFYGLLSFNSNRGYYELHESPYKVTDPIHIQSLGVVTCVNGRQTDASFDAYAVNTRNGQMMWPFALELVESADLLGPDSFVSVLGFYGLAEFRRNMIAWDCGSGVPGRANYGCESFSNGPVVEFLPERGVRAGDARLLYSPDHLSWPYAIKVTAPNGLDTVEILDGDRTVRRWKAGGAQTFERKGSFAVERQHYLWVRARDVRGRFAITRSCNSESFLLRETQCDDRNNILPYMCQKRPDGSEYFMSYAADPCLPSKNPWVGRIRPVGCFVMDKKYGVGGAAFDGSPEDHPQLFMSPSVDYGGEPSASLGWNREFVSGREGGPHVRPYRVVSSQDALVGDHVLDGVYALGRKPIIHSAHSLFPSAESKYAETRARCSLFAPKLDGIYAYQWEQKLVLKEPVPSASGRSVVTFGRMRLSSKLESCDASVDGVRQKAVARAHLSLKPGDFVVAKDRVFGTLVVYPLCSVDFDNLLWTVPGDGSTYPAGTVFTGDFVFVGINKFVKDPFAFAAEIARAYGIGSRTQPSTSYSFKLTAGRGKPNGVCFDAVAENGAFVGTASGLKALPGTLGLRLAGLNDNWSAVVESKADVRLVPVEKGVAYAALRDEESDCDLFVGHPVKASDPRLVVALTRAGKAPWKLEVHNPTDETITAKLSTDAAFKAFKLAKDVEVPAGASVDVGL